LELNYQNKFEIVFCVAVLNHLPSAEVQTQALQNIYQALKPEGYLLMTNWNMWNINNKKSWWRVRSKADLRNVITYWGQEKLPLYYYAFTKRGLKKILTKAGFKVKENYYSLDGKKTSWWRAKNIVSVAQKK
jgi:2-polyprenyl-3-methyl-5-hydroxy-6-metoxy-1,4-benzoquinol methylase